jgi:hypothetical protein
VKTTEKQHKQWRESVETTESSMNIGESVFECGEKEKKDNTNTGESPCGKIRRTPVKVCVERRQ